LSLRFLGIRVVPRSGYDKVVVQVIIFSR